MALVIHRDWVVSDANVAALAMFGYPDLATMKGQQLLQHLGSDEQQALARERLSAVQRGTRLTPVVYQASTRDGRSGRGIWTDSRGGSGPSSRTWCVPGVM